LAISGKAAIAFQDLKRASAHDKRFQQSAISLDVLSQFFDVFEFAELLLDFLLRRLLSVGAYHGIDTRVVREKLQLSFAEHLGGGGHLDTQNDERVSAHDGGNSFSFLRHAVGPDRVHHESSP
jgi:hypothetical protein